jgi:hypothetical protein
MTAEVLSIRRRSGVAGAFTITVVSRHEGEEPMTVTFHGSVYGGPIVMEMGKVQTFVTNPGRFGEKLTEDWVRRFVTELPD